MTQEHEKQIADEYDQSSGGAFCIKGARYGYSLAESHYLPLLEAEKEKVRKLREGLESMIFQYGYRGINKKLPCIGTGGMSALEEAFGLLGWDDPHIVPEEGNTCEIVGCMNDPSSGEVWGDMYLSLCSEHSVVKRNGGERPPIKQYAIEREATRDKETGYLPFIKM